MLSGWGNHMMGCAYLPVAKTVTAIEDITPIQCRLVILKRR
jgi:hypothetical protein